MSVFLKIILGLGAVVLLIASMGMLKFNVLEDDIYVEDEIGQIVHMNR